MPILRWLRGRTSNSFLLVAGVYLVHHEEKEMDMWAAIFGSVD